MELVNGQRDVEDLIDDSALFRFEVLSMLGGFLQSSLVRPASREELMAAAEALNQARPGKAPRQGAGTRALAGPRYP